MQLFYYNNKFIKPIIFIIIKITSNDEEFLLKENTETIFKILIDNNFATDSDILIFNLIKEHEEKIINWILPCTKSNIDIVNTIENDNIINTIIYQTIINYPCQNILELNMDDDILNIHIKNCNLNLGFLGSLYF